MYPRSPVIALLTASAILANPSHGQDNNRKSPPTPIGLELSFKVAAITRGMPEDFVFSLTNKNNHDVQLPTPSIACSDSLNGTVDIGVEFDPMHAGKNMNGGGCAGDTFGSWPSILTRLEGWNTLRPGEALMWSAARKVFHYQDQQPGVYKFWATYKPPYVEKLDQQFLLGSGIDFPSRGLLSSSLQFERKP